VIFAGNRPALGLFDKKIIIQRNIFNEINFDITKQAGYLTIFTKHCLISSL